jgi:hypothetical protein
MIDNYAEVYSNLCLSLTLLGYQHGPKGKAFSLPNASMGINGTISKTQAVAHSTPASKHSLDPSPFAPVPAW